VASTSTWRGAGGGWQLDVPSQRIAQVVPDGQTVVAHGFFSHVPVAGSHACPFGHETSRHIDPQDVHPSAVQSWPLSHAGVQRGSARHVPSWQNCVDGSQPAFAHGLVPQTPTFWAFSWQASPAGHPRSKQSRQNPSWQTRPSVQLTPAHRSTQFPVVESHAKPSPQSVFTHGSGRHQQPERSAVVQAETAPAESTASQL
jgi:hypothetical protein